MDKGCGSVISELYDHIMVGVEITQRSDPEYAKKVLLAAYLAFQPLHLSKLAVTAGLPPNVDLKRIVEICKFFWITKNGVVYLMHQSAKGNVEPNHQFQLRSTGPARGHTDIAMRSINEMSMN